MFRNILRAGKWWSKPREPLWYMLGKELLIHGSPMPREQLISWYEIQRGRDEVVWTLNRMIDAGLVSEYNALHSDGHGTYYVLTLDLPSRRLAEKTAA